MAMTKNQLIKRAAEVTGRFQPSVDCASGQVGAALVTRDGSVYTGVCIDTASSIGFCAEHAAIAEMLKHHESEIAMVVAVNTEGRVLPPCGRCRELIYQVNRANLNTVVIISPRKTMSLADLLPHRWQDAWHQGKA